MNAPKTKGGLNVGIEMRGKTGLGLDPNNYTVYRKKSGDLVVVDKGYRRTKSEMRWKRVGKKTVVGETVRKMMVQDHVEGMRYRFNRNSNYIQETEFLKPASRTWLGMTERGWLDTRSGKFVTMDPVRKFRGELKGELQHELASLDMTSYAVAIEGYGLEEWYIQLSGKDKALLNQHFATKDWKKFWDTYFITSPPEKMAHIDEKAERRGWHEIVDEIREVLGDSYDSWLRSRMGDLANDYL